MLTCNKNDNKSFYRYVRSKSNTKDVVGPLKEVEGRIITDDLTMSTILNQFFSSTFTKENSEAPEMARRAVDGEDQGMYDITITLDMVKSMTDKLKKGKAPGDDGLTPKFLKKCRRGNSKPLAMIFNRGLDNGVVPQDWKMANVTAVFNKGSRHDPGNYRPVSLTSHIGILLPSLIRDEMVRHLKENKLINKSQHGFMGKRSCLTNLLEFLEYITIQIDEGNPVDVIYLDFQIAFDKVRYGTSC